MCDSSAPSSLSLSHSFFPSLKKKLSGFSLSAVRRPLSAQCGSCRERERGFYLVVPWRRWQSKLNHRSSKTCAQSSLFLSCCFFHSYLNSLLSRVLFHSSPPTLENLFDYDSKIFCCNAPTSLARCCILFSFGFFFPLVTDIDQRGQSRRRISC